MTGQLVSVGELVRAHYGKALKDSDRRGGGQHDVYGSSGIIGRHDQCLVPYPTVVIGRKGSVGSVTFAPNGGWPIDTAFFIELREPERADLRYLYWALSNARLDRRAITKSIPSLNRDELYRAKIRLPALSEQHRIAAMLDKADDVRRKQRDGLSLVGQLQDSAFLEMFGDPRTNERDWDVVSLEQVSQIVSGVTKGRKLPPHGVRQVPYLRVANVQDGYLNVAEVKTIDATLVEIDRYRLRDGDILLTKGGDSDKLGRGAVWRGEVEECIHQNHIFRVRLVDTDLTPDYVSALLGSAYGKRFFLKAAKQTTGIASINRTQLARFPVIRAPVELQHRYAALLGCTHGVAERVSAAGRTADQLYDALVARVFSG